MSQTPPSSRPPYAGPWGSLPERPAGRAETRPTPAPEEKGQGLVWSILSTLLLGGFIWYRSQSWVIAVAAIVSCLPLKGRQTTTPLSLCLTFLISLFPGAS